MAYNILFLVYVLSYSRDVSFD